MSELRRYCYVVESELHSGTIHDIAYSMQQAYYAGLSVDNHVVSMNENPAPGTLFRQDIVTTETSDYNSDDYAVVTVRCRDDVSTFTVDGRA